LIPIFGYYLKKNFNKHNLSDDQFQTSKSKSATLDVNCKNADGLTPLLLVTRDLNLFEKSMSLISNHMLLDVYFFLLEIQMYSLREKRMGVFISHKVQGADPGGMDWVASYPSFWVH